MSRRSIPELTHLQFLVLGILRSGTHTGRHVRRALSKHGIRRTAPAFYQMMARLEDAAFVSGEYDQKVVDGQIIKERRYTLTAKGDAAWTATRTFYADAIDAYGSRKPGVAHA
jgi:DNA-binding PadR family transcriptional regulator